MGTAFHGDVSSSGRPSDSRPRRTTGDGRRACGRPTKGGRFTLSFSPAHVPRRISSRAWQPDTWAPIGSGPTDGAVASHLRRGAAIVLLPALDDLAAVARAA